MIMIKPKPPIPIAPKDDLELPESFHDDGQFPARTVTTPNEVIVETERPLKKIWVDLKEIVVGKDKKLRKRSLADVLIINNMMIKDLPTGVKAAESESLKDFEELKEINKMLEASDNNWEEVMKKIKYLNRILESLGDLSQIYDVALLHLEPIQIRLNPQLLRSLLLRSNNNFQSNSYGITMAFQKHLLKIFAFLHFEADTLFLPRISTGNLNIMNPFSRVSVRKRNRSNQFLLNKYESPSFNFKQFIRDLLDHYFMLTNEAHSFDSHEIHRVILRMALKALEIGWYANEEVEDLISDILNKLNALQKIEEAAFKLVRNVGTEEKQEGKDKKDELNYLREIFFDCREIAANIFTHIILIINDVAFEQNFKNLHRLEKKLMRIKDSEIKQEAANGTMIWERAFFNGTNVTKEIHRVLMSYLMDISEDIPPERKSDLGKALSELLKMITDFSDDTMYVSMDSLPPHLFEYYSKPETFADVQESGAIRAELVTVLSYMANPELYLRVKSLPKASTLSLSKMIPEVENELEKVLQWIQSVIRQRDNEDQKKCFKYRMGEDSIPSILLCMMLLSEHLKSNLSTKKLLFLVFVSLCEDNVLGQIDITKKYSVLFWENMFELAPLLSVHLIDSVFVKEFTLYFSHRYLFDFFLPMFKLQIKENWGIKIEGKETIHDKLEGWFQNFNESVKNDLEALELDSFTSYYFYCRFLIKMLKYTPNHHDEKFYTLRIQYILIDIFVNFFLKIILDPMFLPKKDGKYDFSPIFELKSNEQLIDFYYLQMKEILKETELRGVLFEISMMTMKLMCKCSRELYLNSVFLTVKSLLSEILKGTEYLFEIPIYGIVYRGIIVEFYGNFSLFPSAHRFTGRSADLFKDGKGHKIFASDLINDTIFKVILNELEKFKSMVEKGDQEEKLKEDLTIEAKNRNSYLLQGLLRVMIQYFRGVYGTFVMGIIANGNKESIENVTTRFLKFEKSFMEYKDIFGRFNVILEIGSPEQRGTLPEAEAGNKMNQVFPKENAKPHTKNFSPRKQLIDEEKNPQLTVFRDVVYKMLHMIENIIQKADPELFNKVNEQYRLVSLLDCTDGNPEPWKRLEEEYSETTNTFTLKKSNISVHYRAYLQMVALYRKEKEVAVKKPKEENAFIDFIENKSSKSENLILFLFRLFNIWFADAKPPSNPTEEQMAATRAKAPNLLESVVITYLESDIIHNFLMYFSHAFTCGDKLRNDVYALMYDEVWKDEMRFTISVLFTQVIAISSLSINLLFTNRCKHNFTKKLETLSKFFCGLSFNNSRNFKKFFGTEVLPLTTLNGLVAEPKSTLYRTYVVFEQSASGFEFFDTVKYREFTLQNRPADLPGLISLCKFLTELCTGNMVDNQKQISNFRTDTWLSIVNRLIYDIDSSFYEFKNIIMNYILSLFDGDDPNQVKYFGSNTTAEALLNNIYLFLKLLYIGLIIKKDKSKYLEIFEYSKSKRLEDEKKNIQRRINRMEEDKAAGIVNLYSLTEYKELTPEEKQAKETAERQTEAHQKKNLIINESMMKYFKVDDYKDILNLYLSDEQFSNHPIFQFVLKLNKMLISITKFVESFNIQLRMTHIKLMQKYGSEVSERIFIKYSDHADIVLSSEALEEKYVFYMFLTKITSEVELVEAETKRLHRVAFALHPSTFFLPKYTKGEFMENTNIKSMVNELVWKYNKFGYEMHTNWKFNSKWPLLYRIASDDFFNFLKIFLWFLGAILNIFLVIFYRQNDSQVLEIVWPGLLLIRIAAFVLIAVSGTFLIIWLACLYRQKVGLAKLDLEFASEDKDQKDVNRVKKLYTLYFKKSILDEEYPVFFSLVVVFNALGLFINPFFYSLQLLTIVFILRTTNYVVQAITTHFDQLALTLTLSYFVIYMFAVLAAGQFWNTFTSNVPGSGYYNCTTLWDCTLYAINMSFRGSGGFGFTMNLNDPFGSANYYVEQFFYEILIFLAINIITLNIFFGIIVNTFKTMREEISNQGNGHP